MSRSSPFLGILQKSHASQSCTFPHASLAVSSVASGHSWSGCSPLAAYGQVGSGTSSLGSWWLVTALDNSDLLCGASPAEVLEVGIGPEKFQSQTISPGRKREGGYFSKGSDSHTHKHIHRPHQREKKASWPVLTPVGI